MPANESYVGRATSAVQQRLNIDDAGFKALKADLAMSNKVLQDGLIMGAITLASGGGKVKAAWEGIKWGWMARAGVAGLAMVTGAAYALAIGIRKGVTESGVLQAALQRLDQTKVLTAQFTSILGSISAARTRVGELFAFVANSKFNFGDVAGASRAISAHSRCLARLPIRPETTFNRLGLLTVSSSHRRAMVRTLPARFPNSGTWVSSANRRPVS
jgi:hypothetical protein